MSSRKRSRRGLIAVAAAAASLVTVGALATPGDLDPGFGSGGVVLTDFESDSSDRAAALALQPDGQDGKIIAAGSSFFAGRGAAFALARYRTDGSLDRGFGSNGKVLTSFGAPGRLPPVDEAYAVALQPDGKIVAAGAGADGGHLVFALARYRADGSLDPHFGAAGRVLTNLGSASNDSLQAVAVQSDGRIVAAGQHGAGQAKDFALLRYREDGSPDPTFGQGGIVLTDVGSESVDGAAGVIVLPGGEILVAGYTIEDRTADIVLLRYRADGSIDPAFGTGGKVVTDLGSSSDDVASGVAVQADGGILVAGYSDAAGSNDFALVRYRPDGTLDSSFGSGGKVLTDLGSSSLDLGWAVALAPDGAIVVAGSSDATGVNEFAVARYDANGTLDSGFGSGGIVLTNVGSGPSGASAAAIQPEGRIVVAGVGDTGASADFAVVRYLSGGMPLTVRIVVLGPTRPRQVGRIPVAILSSEVFDATAVEPRSACLGDAENAAQRDCTAVLGKSLRRDVNRDGRRDLVLVFDLGETGIDAGDTQACLTGRTFSGTEIQGCGRILSVFPQEQARR